MEQHHETLAKELWGIANDPLTLAGGGAILTGMWAWMRRGFKRRKRARELEKIEAEALQVILEDLNYRDEMVSTARVKHIDQAEMYQRKGAYRQRRREIADKLREALGNDRRLDKQARAAYQQQDMFKREDLEHDE